MSLITYIVYPLANIQAAIENGPVEIVCLPSYKMVDIGGSFHRFFLTFTRPGNHHCSMMFDDDT